MLSNGAIIADCSANKATLHNYLSYSQDRSEIDFNS